MIEQCVDIHLAPSKDELPSLRRALDDIRFDSDAGANLTVRDYLAKLLDAVWVEGEGFSGKRPFGNSGWEMDLYTPLVDDGFIAGKIDREYGTYDIDDYVAASDYVRKLIHVMCYGK
jgi:hypothetical protein